MKTIDASKDVDEYKYIVVECTVSDALEAFIINKKTATRSGVKEREKLFL